MLEVLDATGEPRVAERLADYTDMRLIEPVNSTDAMLAAVRRLRPPSLLVAAHLLGTQPADVYRDIHAASPDTHVVTLLGRNEKVNEAIRNAAISAGYYTWVQSPITIDGIREALLRRRSYADVRSEHTASVQAGPGPESQPGQPQGQILFLSPYAGGTGASTLALNTAIALSTRHRVCLLDYNLQNPDQHLLLGSPAAINHALARNLFTLQLEVGRDPRDIAQVLIDEHLYVVHERLHVLAGAVGSPEDAQEVGGRLPERLFEVLKARYDFIVVDGGRAIESEAVYPLLGRTDLYLVTTQDVIRAAAVQRLQRYLTGELALPRNKLHMVINGYDALALPNQLQIERIADMTAAATIPYDLQAARSAPLKGVPLLLLPGTEAKALRAAFHRLGEVVVATGRTAPAPPSPTVALAR